MQIKHGPMVCDFLNVENEMCEIIIVFLNNIVNVYENGVNRLFWYLFVMEWMA